MPGMGVPLLDNRRVSGFGNVPAPAALTVPRMGAYGAMPGMGHIQPPLPVNGGPYLFNAPPSTMYGAAVVAAQPPPPPSEPAPVAMALRQPPPPPGQPPPPAGEPSSAFSPTQSGGGATVNEWKTPEVPSFEAAVSEMIRHRVWKYRQKDHWLYLEEAEAVTLHDRLTKTVVHKEVKSWKSHQQPISRDSLEKKVRKFVHDHVHNSKVLNAKAT